MEFTLISAVGVLFLFMVWRLVNCFWVSPIRAHRKLRRNGFGGPSPRFPLGNLPDIKEIKKKKKKSENGTGNSSSSLSSCFGSSIISHDIHSTVFPHFSSWRESHGKVFVYWLGTEPFLYVADPEFIKQMSEGVMARSWGKPTVFKMDRLPMFGMNGLVMVEGDNWVRHRNGINPAFTPLNLKAMTTLMVDTTNDMLNHWATLVGSNKTLEIDVGGEMLWNTGLIIAKTSFNSMSQDDGRKVFEKLTAMQTTLFRSNRYLGVPYSQFLYPQQALEEKRLGKDIDKLLQSIILARKKSVSGDQGPPQDLLGILLNESRPEKVLTTRELIDECKTIFFAGYETTALAITWTLLMLAVHPQWQSQLRDEVREVVGEGELEFNMLRALKKMGWVMNEVLRLYSPGPNAQRQTREDIRVGDKVIPNGTNIWIDIVAMNHDPSLWGDDVNEFRPERFKDNVHGGCNHKMGFLPFGFGGRMCVGRNLTTMEYKIVLARILTRFSFSLSPTYSHSPSYLLSVRPECGLPLILRPLSP